MLREGTKSGPNFAGHYTVIVIGRMYAIVDSKTGAVYFLDDGGLEFESRIDSSLLIFNPPNMIKEMIEKYNSKEDDLFRYNYPRYYKWENNKLVLVFSAKGDLSIK